MPTSSYEGRDWVCTKASIMKNIKTVLDVGAGVGTYVKLLRAMFPDSVWVGVEAWLPYVNRYKLKKIYDLLIISDIYRVHAMHGLDLVIFGDVLEHLEKDKAIKVYERFRKAARYIIIVMPIKRYVQGAIGGNPYEEHKAQWTHKEILKKFKGIKYWKEGKKKGCYLVVNKGVNK